MTTPPPSTSLVALKERRTAVIAALSHAFARDELDVDELDLRIERAHLALTVAELDALVVDLAAPPATSAITVRSLTSGVSVSAATERPPQQHLVSIVGGVQRSGAWIVPQHLRVHCVMGGVSLDFREAHLGAGVTEISITCLMGGVEIIVPPDVRIDLAGSAILGGFDQAHRGADVITTEPVATLRISGIAIAGGVSIETRRIGESSREARKRIKAERKQLFGGRKPGQAALPSAVVVPERKPKR